MTGTTLTWPRRGTFIDRERVNDEGQNPTHESNPSDDDFATIEVEDDDRVARLKERGWVEGTPEENDLTGDDDDGGATAAAREVDPDVFVQAFVSQGATEQVDAIEAGEVDDYLDAIEAANADGEDYQTVADAIDERRDELSG